MTTRSSALGTPYILARRSRDLELHDVPEAAEVGVGRK